MIHALRLMFTRSRTARRARLILEASFSADELAGMSRQLDRMERINQRSPERQARMDRERAKQDFYDDLASE